MTEADRPANQQLPPSDTPVSSTAPLLSDEEWQTVDFPNALRVKDIPTTPATDQPNAPEWSGTADSRKNPFFATPVAGATAPAPVTLIQALHECNRDLAQRVAQLEVALEESQNNQATQTSLLEQRTTELQEAQEQLTRLFSKLELTQQVIRNQEVQLESLTQQLETGHTRLATVERECALTQQRYHERLHQLVQAENACRELRSRLHRQQRHTLQFKAALERCLEMPQIKSQITLPKGETGEDATNGEGLEETTALNDTVLQWLSTSPVKPWSAAPDPASENALPEDVKTETPEDAPSNPSAVQDSPAPELQSITANEPVSEVVTTPALNPIPEGPKVQTPPTEELPPMATPLTFTWPETIALEGLEIKPSPSPLIESPPPKWLASLTYGATPKKRRSLAEIELPSFI